MLLPTTNSTTSSALNTAQSGNSGNLFSGSTYIVNRQDDNRLWAEEQAQKQMDYQTNSNKIAMDFSAEQAQIARDYETEMSNTAYQRAVADLKAAGLNPTLAYSQGGASTPSAPTVSGVSSAGALANTADLGYTADKHNADMRWRVFEHASDSFQKSASDLLNYVKSMQTASMDAVVKIASQLL